MAKKVSLVERLVNEGWFDDEKQAAAWVMERKVLLDDNLMVSPKEKVSTEGIIRVKDYYKSKYVNKGGYKLEGALREFNINIDGKTVLDCGASTGGFTDCLIQQGAECVYAVDVGYGQLAGKLAINPRVINMEKTNLSSDRLFNLIPKPQLITLDLSYLSLRKALPICRKILHNNGEIVALIKPLFEVDSSEIRRTGKIDDCEILYKVLSDICTFCEEENFNILGITFSPIRGNSGTLEYFIHLSCGNATHINKVNSECIFQVVSKSMTIGRYHKNKHTTNM